MIYNTYFHYKSVVYFVVFVSSSFCFKGQCLESCSIEEVSQSVFVRCRRDRRYKVKDPITGTPCTIEVELH